MAVKPDDVMANPNDQLALGKAMSYIVARTGRTYGQVVLATKEEAVAGAEKSSQELKGHLKTCQMCTNERTADEWCRWGKEHLTLIFCWCMVALAKGAGLTELPGGADVPQA